MEQRAPARDFEPLVPGVRDESPEEVFPFPVETDPLWPIVTILADIATRIERERAAGAHAS